MLRFAFWCDWRHNATDQNTRSPASRESRASCLISTGSDDEFGSGQSIAVIALGVSRLVMWSETATYYRRMNRYSVFVLSKCSSPNRWSNLISL